MYSHSDTAEYKYVAYIDESGDTGLKAVKPIDQKGSSEWFILSAVVVSAKNELLVPNWVTDVCSQFKGHQQHGFHFRHLNPAKKHKVCKMMSQSPIRIFTIACNKKNMREYRNRLAEKVPSDDWFYCWVSRLLLERVTYFVKTHSQKTYGCCKKVKLIFSENKELNYSQMGSYYEWFRHRSSVGKNFLPQGNISWATIHPSLFEVVPHKEELGLHLADAAAHSFFKACDRQDTRKIDPQFAKSLHPRMARQPDELGGLVAGYGLKLMPNLKIARLDQDQLEIFKFYGYPKQWWAPN